MNWRVILSGLVALLGSAAGTKVLNLAIIAVATRELGIEAVGLVFFVEAAASIGLRTLDLGFYEVLVRRTAREEVTRGTIKRALAFRGSVLIVATMAVGAIAWFIRPERALVATGFFGVFGVFYLHEIGRAVLAGNEMFGRNAVIALVSRGLGVTVAIAGMLSNRGIEAWLVGMAIAEVLQLVWVSSVAWRATPTTGDDRPLFKEGLAFWALALLKVSVGQGSAIIVGAWLGFAANGIFGVANKVVQGGLLLIVGLTYAAYPSMARDRRRTIGRELVIAVMVVAAIATALIIVAAPILSGLLGEGDVARTVEVTRWLAPAAFLMAIGQALDTWIRAKDGERGLVGVAIVEGVVLLGSMAALVHFFGLMGAVVATTTGALVRLVGVALLARNRTRR